MNTNTNDPIGSTSIFVYQVSITQDMLDELGHANYNELKKVFETVRHRLCKHLGFGRKTLRKKLNVGLVMIEDTYKYHKSLKIGDTIFFLAKIEAISATRLVINLRVCRWCTGLLEFAELSNEVSYTMALINLKTEKAVRIPKPIVKEIEKYTTTMERLSTQWK